MEQPANEFEEIGHSGGKVTFRLATTEQGRRSYQISITGNRPVRMELIAVWALPDGVLVASSNLGGRGDAPPLPGCFQVFIASDSEGRFGHHCPDCQQYWRSGPWPNVCPYCATMAGGHRFLSHAQLRYVKEYCDLLVRSLDSAPDGDVVIDMDAVADAVGKEGEKPAFYVSEKSQQRKFTCRACGDFNDILGQFGHCSLCGTRNDLAEFEDTIVPAIRERLRAGHAGEDCVRDGVAAFDSFVAQYAKQLAALVPMTERRRARLLRPFHNIPEVRELFRDAFDVDISSGVQEEDWQFLVRMFLRRHVYEHNGGEVDQKYLDESDDSTVVLKQRIHETQETGHRLLSSLVKMARNVQNGFHELFPPISAPIAAFEERKAREPKRNS